MSGLSGPIGFGILTLIVFYFAKRGRYFDGALDEANWKFPIRWHHVVSIFVIYFATVILLVPIIAVLMRPLLASSPPIGIATWLNFLTSFFILASIVIYLYFIPRDVAWKIWKRSDTPSFLQDIGFAFISFVIAFPLVIFLNESFDFILSYFFNIHELPDQLAVRFLKMSFEHPKYFFLSIVTVVAFAPMLEEVMFRGFLQSFIRQHLGSKSAILLTALSFSFFHYSPEQGLSNISIIGSLFGLALFLGYVYEKQGSLVASMTLHASFNAISVLNLYFLGGFPKAI